MTGMLFCRPGDPVFRNSFNPPDYWLNVFRAGSSMEVETHEDGSIRLFLEIYAKKYEGHHRSVRSMISSEIAVCRAEKSVGYVT